jgi:phosphate uptake regulator
MSREYWVLDIMKFKNKKVQQIRTSFSVTLPVEWVRSNQMKKGDFVEIVSIDDENLKISHVPKSGAGVHSNHKELRSDYNECEKTNL